MCGQNIANELVAIALTMVTRSLMVANVVDRYCCLVDLHPGHDANRVGDVGSCL